MPKYVAERALDLVDTSISFPKVLILGVAYKSGVSDVRESPVSQLRMELQSLGAQVAWHDPFVQTWEGTEPAGLDWDCDVAILATRQPGTNLDAILSKGIKILDCTNSAAQIPGLTSL
jgi:UDP-N-acetyl-D-mannosaminuronate dehydrogenase